MRRTPNRREQLTALFVVLGAAVVFAPALWVLGRWREAVGRYLAGAWGAPWLGEQLEAHPYLTVVAILLCVALSSGIVMLLLVVVAKRLATRLTGRTGAD